MKIKLMTKFLLKVLPNNVAGITLAPFGIYLRRSLTDKITNNHESIHWKQQIEMLIIFFYLWYIIEYGIRAIKHGDGAYMKLSFEREAYEHERDLTYLEKRKMFSWIKFL